MIGWRSGVPENGVAMNRDPIQFKRRMSARPKRLTNADYVRLADFRYALRCFLEFSQAAAAKEGLTPQQHQAMLVIRASPGETATVGRLAERLRLRHHSAVELAQRLEVAGLISRQVNPDDRRAILLQLTAEGAGKLETLTHSHRSELKQIGPGILELFESLDGANRA